MAIEIEIPKDITKYESKLIGPFTTRQTLCLVPAVALAVLVFVGLKSYVSQTLLIGLLMVCVAPFLLFGWYKPYGLPLEKFLKTAFISNVLAPKARKYKTENTIIVEDDEEISENNKNKQNKNKKNANKKQHKPSQNYVAYK